MKIIDGILATFPEFQAIRHDIHAHPELGYEEQRTAQLVAEHLQSWGYQVTTGVAGTGVVGTLTRGTSGRSIGLRADMDALPLEEANNFAHRSQHPGRMHACGHDGHTTTLLAAARHLSENARFNGTVHLVFQPAEEGGAGARTMIEEGLFERFPCDMVFGAHNWPGIPVGQAGIKSGPLMGSSNEFEITITGKGAHAALPQNGIDPVLTATHLVQAFQSIISRNKNPIEAAVLSVTEIHAGDATNIIPNTATLRGTVRTFSIDMLDLIESRMRAITDNLCAAFHATAQFEFTRNYPPTINHPQATELMHKVLVDVLGEAQVINPVEPTLGAEDFSFMLLKRPGCYFFLGNGEGEHRIKGHGSGPCMLHNPSYDFNDQLIPIGATVWVRLVEACLPATATPLE
ncbi:MAG: M20 aminoacylase family protein [Lautropia sp.]|nr:M20 aminoacylase family protein [Lautropia sp.]